MSRKISLLVLLAALASCKSTRNNVADNRSPVERADVTRKPKPIVTIKECHRRFILHGLSTLDGDSTELSEHMSRMNFILVFLPNDDLTLGNLEYLECLSQEYREDENVSVFAIVIEDCLKEVESLVILRNLKLRVLISGKNRIELNNKLKLSRAHENLTEKQEEQIKKKFEENGKMYAKIRGIGLPPKFDLNKMYRYPQLMVVDNNFKVIHREYGFGQDISKKEFVLKWKKVIEQSRE